MSIGMHILALLRNPMTTKPGRFSLLVVGFLAASLPLLAHHGNTSYDTSKTVTVKGTVTQYVWANPHVLLKVDAKDDSGNTQHWVIEAQSVTVQAGKGWSYTMFKPGDQVVIDVTPAKSGQPIGEFRAHIVINGQEFKSQVTE
jgi:hypothetical protein